MSTQRPKQPLQASRVLGVAEEIAGVALDADAAFSRKVVLTGEVDALATENGRWCFLNSIRLLCRTVGELYVVLPEGASPALVEDVGDLVANAWSQRSLQMVSPDEADMAGATAILNVGCTVVADLPWTAISSNGWVARCSSGQTHLPGDFSQPNPMGAMLAASLGVTEVFKRVYGVSTPSRPLFGLAEFSLFEMSDKPTGPGPELPAVLNLPDTVVVGGGAIGNALVLLMSQLPLQGRVHLVDKQSFATENLGTCCLLDDLNWLGKAKAELLASWLRERNPSIEVTGEQAQVVDALSGSFIGSMRTNLLLNGLDDNQARHDAQKLWPSLTIDGAINSFGAAVVSHSLAHQRWACLRCTFSVPRAGALEARAAALGLAAESLSMTDRAITAADIADAPSPAAKSLLRQAQAHGKTLCSTIPALEAAARLGVELADGFRPSVPFVASASAALVMAQLYRSMVWPAEPFLHEFQLADLFLGPATGYTLFREARADCLCVVEAESILELASRRTTIPPGAAGPSTAA